VANPVKDWRFVLCDFLGVPIAVLSAVASDKQLDFRLGRPARCSFTVPSAEPLVNLSHTDGFPYLSTGRRTVKAYRREGAAWVLRFVGYVWQLGDAGDADTMRTAVTCFDPMQRLARRIVRDAPGAVTATILANGGGAAIAKDLVDATNLHAGATGITTTGGTFATTPTLSYSFEPGTFIGPTIVELCDTDTVDVYFDPIDATDGLHVRMNAVAQRGTDRPHAKFGYARGNHANAVFQRTEDMEQVANDLTILGGPAETRLQKRLTDAASIAAFGVYEDARAVTLATTQDRIDAIAAGELDFRVSPVGPLKVVPQPERAPVPWDEYFLGDTVRHYLSADTREAAVETQRVHGITVNIDDDGFESVGELLTAADV